LHEVGNLKGRLDHLFDAYNSLESVLRSDLENNSSRIDEQIRDMMDKVHESLEFKMRDAEGNLAEILEEALIARVTEESKKLKKKLSDKLKGQYDEFTKNIDMSMMSAKEALVNQNLELHSVSDAKMHAEVREILDSLTQQQENELSRFIELAKQELDKCISRTELKLSDDVNRRIGEEVLKMTALCEHNRVEDKLILKNSVVGIEKEVSAMTQASSDYVKSMEKSCERKIMTSFEIELSKLQQQSNLKMLELQKDIQDFKQLQMETQKISLNRQQETIDEKLTSSLLRFRDDLGLSIEGKTKSFQLQLMTVNEQMLARLTEKIAAGLQCCKDDLNNVVDVVMLQISASQAQCQQLVTQQAMDCSVELKRTCSHTVDLAVDNLSSTSRSIFQHVKDDAQQYIEDHLGKVEMEVKTMWSETGNLLHKNIIHELEKIRIYDKERMQRVDETLSYLEIFALKMERDFQNVSPRAEDISNPAESSGIPQPNFLSSLPIQISSDIDINSLSFSYPVSSPSIAPYRSPGYERSSTGNANNVKLADAKSSSQIPREPEPALTSVVHFARIEFRIQELNQLLESLKNKVSSLDESTTHLEKKLVDIEDDNIKNVFPKLNESQLQISLFCESVNLLQREHTLLANKIAEGTSAPTEQSATMEVNSHDSSNGRSCAQEPSLDHCRLDTLQNFVNSLQVEVISLGAELKLKTEASAHANLNVDVKLSELDSVRAQLQDFDCRMNALSVSVTTNNRDMESYITLVESLNHDYSGSEQKLTAVEVKIDGTVDNVRTNTLALGSVDKRLSLLEEQTQLLNIKCDDSLDQVKQCLLAHSTCREHFTEEISQNKVKLAELTSSLLVEESNVERLTMLQTTLSAQALQLGDTEFSLKQNHRTVELLEQQLCETVLTCEKVGSELSDIKNSCGQMELSLHELRLQVASAASNAASPSSTVSFAEKLREDFAMLQSEVRELQQHLQSREDCAPAGDLLIAVDRFAEDTVHEKLLAFDKCLQHQHGVHEQIFSRLNELTSGALSHELQIDDLKSQVAEFLLESDVMVAKAEQRKLIETLDGISLPGYARVCTEVVELKASMLGLSERFSRFVNSATGDLASSTENNKHHGMCASLPRAPPKIDCLMSHGTAVAQVFNSRGDYDFGQDDSSFCSRDEPDADSVTKQVRVVDGTVRSPPSGSANFDEAHLNLHVSADDSFKDENSIATSSENDEGDNDANDSSVIDFDVTSAAVHDVPDSGYSVAPVTSPIVGRTDPQAGIMGDSFNISFENEEQESVLYNTLFRELPDDKNVNSNGAALSNSPTTASVLDASGADTGRGVNDSLCQVNWSVGAEDQNAQAANSSSKQVGGDDRFSFDRIYSVNSEISGVNKLGSRRSSPSLQVLVAVGTSPKSESWLLDNAAPVTTELSHAASKVAVVDSALITAEQYAFVIIGSEGNPSSIQEGLPKTTTETDEIEQLTANLETAQVALVKHALANELEAASVLATAHDLMDHNMGAEADAHGHHDRSDQCEVPTESSAVPSYPNIGDGVDLGSDNEEPQIPVFMSPSKYCHFDTGADDDSFESDEECSVGTEDNNDRALNSLGVAPTLALGTAAEEVLSAHSNLHVVDFECSVEFLNANVLVESAVGEAVEVTVTNVNVHVPEEYIYLESHMLAMADNIADIFGAGVLESFPEGDDSVEQSENDKQETVRSEAAVRSLSAVDVIKTDLTYRSGPTAPLIETDDVSRLKAFGDLDAEEPAGLVSESVDVADHEAGQNSTAASVEGTVDERITCGGSVSSNEDHVVVTMQTNRYAAFDGGMNEDISSSDDEAASSEAGLQSMDSPAGIVHLAFEEGSLGNEMEDIETSVEIADTVSVFTFDSRDSTPPKEQKIKAIDSGRAVCSIDDSLLESTSVVVAAEAPGSVQPNTATDGQPDEFLKPKTSKDSGKVVSLLEGSDDGHDGNRLLHLTKPPSVDEESAGTDDVNYFTPLAEELVKKQLREHSERNRHLGTATELGTATDGTRASFGANDDDDCIAVPVNMNSTKYAGYDVGMDDDSFASSDDGNEDDAAEC
jgi:hypothetical protein